MHINFRKRPVLWLFSFVFIVTLLLIGIAEYALRKAGFQPGQINYSPWFSPVDSLKVNPGLIADEYGIMKYSQAERQQIAGDIAKGEGLSTSLFHNELVKMFHDVNTGSLSNDFAKMIGEIRKRKPEGWSGLDSALINYVYSPINSDGFRSVEFRKYENDKPSILILGDSFAWGVSTSNYTESFPDLLMSMGYVVYNTGLPGADVSQYLAIARYYIPRLKPDIVVLNFYIGNDLVDFRREIRPYRKIYYHTNAGNLYTCPQGVYLDSPKQAYQLIMSERFIPQINRSFFNRLCSKTVLTTRLWGLLNRFQMIEHNHAAGFEEYWEKVNNLPSDKSVIEQDLRKIRDISLQHGSYFLLVAIPEFTQLEWRIPDDYPGFLTELQINVPDMNEADFNAEVAYGSNTMVDGHYNEKGHRKHAMFIDSIISTIESNNKDNLE